MVRPVEPTPGRPAEARRSPAIARVWARNPDFVFRRIAGEVLLLPIREKVGDLESIYALNEVGARVWELLDGRRSVADLRDSIVAEFDVSPDRAEADILEFLGKLEALEGVVPA
jgi:hypothetical protein